MLHDGRKTVIRAEQREAQAFFLLVGKRWLHALTRNPGNREKRRGDKGASIYENQTPPLFASHKVAQAENKSKRMSARCGE